jgi:hypothetical protein
MISKTDSMALIYLLQYILVKVYTTNDQGLTNSAPHGSAAGIQFKHEDTKGTEGSVDTVPSESPG